MRHNQSRASAATLGSVSNALRVLSLLKAGDPVTLTLVSDRLSVGKSTAHRILVTLVDEGFLQRDPARRGAYLAGPSLLELAASYHNRLDIRRQARRPMQHLADTLGETVNLVVLEGNTTRVLDGIESRAAVRVGLRTGVVLPANATAAGKILLAALDDDALTALFPQGLPSLTTRTAATWPDLRAQLQQAREGDVAYSAGESEPGLHGLAVPVRDHANTVIAALAIAAPHYRLTPRALTTPAQILRDAAAAIQHALGA